MIYEALFGTNEFTLALAKTAPVYNLALVIVVVYLFIKLLRMQKEHANLVPWKILFAAVMIFIAEELLTVLRSAGIIDIPRHVNGFFELIIISLFIYTLLLQKQINK